MANREEIKLDYESLISLLQGKKLHLETPNVHLVISPPFDGVFLTHEQIDEIKNAERGRILSLLNEAAKHVQKA